MRSLGVRRQESIADTADPLALDEQAWVARVRDGDMPALERMFDMYGPHLLAYARSRLGGTADTAHDAASVVHDVFVALWRGRAEWTVTQSIRAYLFSAVHHRVVNAQRDRRRLWRRMVETETLPVVTARGRTDDEADTRDLAAAAARALATLPERNREVYRLVREHELTHADVAQMLGISVKAVEGHMARAITALRVSLADWNP